MVLEKKFIAFAKPDVGDEEIAAVTEVLRSGWLTTGSKAFQFERAFEGFLGSGVHALAVNSATAGLHLALEAVGIGPGDEVITTTYTFTATAEVIRYLGAHPVLVDINPSTLCIDIAAVEHAITSRTKAVIPVHFGGCAVDMDALLILAKRHGIRVIEDAAHALPTRYNNNLIGTLDSDATVFSFYANKTMTTGEGGMLVTRDPRIVERAKVMRLHGISKDAFNRFTSKKPDWYYEVVAPGYKYNMTDIAAAIGIEQLKKLSDFQQRRSDVAQFYNSELSALPLILPSTPIDCNLHSWHLYVIQLTEEVPLSRDEFVKRMYDFGVGCSVHYIPLHLHPYWRDKYDLKPEMFPNSQRVFERCVSLPIYSSMSDEDLARVRDVIKSIIG